MEKLMTRRLKALAAARGLTVAAPLAAPAFAQKPGGVLRIHHQDSPASMSIHEEATYSTVVPIMGVMNNLVLYKQDVPQNSLQSVVPELGRSGVGTRSGRNRRFFAGAGCVRRRPAYHPTPRFTGPMRNVAVTGLELGAG